jgi:hypothetical protein
MPVDKVSLSIASVGTHFRVGGNARAVAVSVSAATVKRCTCIVSLRCVKTWSKESISAMCFAWQRSSCPISRLEMYFCAAVFLCEAEVVVAGIVL